VATKSVATLTTRNAVELTIQTTGLQGSRFITFLQKAPVSRDTSNIAAFGSSSVSIISPLCFAMDFAD
jgi:hypothetical protein